MRVQQPKSNLRARIDRHERLIGTFVSSTDPAMTDIVGAAGFDFVVVDHEHGPIGHDTAQHHARSAELAGMVPFVRVGETNANLVGKFLDLGFQGVLAPHVDTAEQARKLVAATRFAPRGTRGVCPASHAAGYSGAEILSFSQDAERETIVAVIIESIKGVENVAEIAAVEGLDAIFFGPGDLAYDLEVFDQGLASPVLQEAWQTVATATREASKWLMALAIAGQTDEDTVQSADGLFAEGVDLVVLHVDLLLVRRMMERLARAKVANGT